MAEFVVEEPACEMKCNTCKASFCSAALIKEHYRGDLHVLNSKRRANNLKSISEQDFLLLVKNAPKPARMLNPGRATYVAPKAKVEPKAAKKDDISTASSPVDKADGEADEEEETVQEEQKEVIPPKLGTNISIFDDKEFETMDECVSYMALNFGFFVPDIEYLKDMSGLLSYLGEKVKLGNYCLYCQKKFGTFRSCQNHMTSKSHCKIAYVEDVSFLFVTVCERVCCVGY